MAGKYQVMPELSPVEYEELKASIAAYGVLVPVEYDESGNVLDGNHRVRACEELGIKDFPSIVRVGMSEDDKRAHARRLNLTRRHLSQEQKRELVRAQLIDTPERSDRQIAEALGVSHPTVGALRDELERDGDVERFTTSIDTLGREQPRKRSVVAKSQREARMTFEALAEMDTGALPDKMIDAKRATRLSREYRAQERAKDIAPESGDGSVTLWLGDFRERGQDIPAESVDLIFTDPPYPREFLPLWSDLSAFAARVLKPDGMLIAYTGALDLPEVIWRLNECLTYWWTGAIVLDGAHSRVHARQVVQGVKPLLFFVQDGGKPAAWVEDTYHSEGEQKDAHDWQQSIGAAEYYIGRLTPPDGLVVDPFLGGGTTGAAAKRLGRHFIGIEIDRVAYASATRRIANG